MPFNFMKHDSGGELHYVGDQFWQCQLLPTISIVEGALRSVRLLRQSQFFLSYSPFNYCRRSCQSLIVVLLKKPYAAARAVRCLLSRDCNSPVSLRWSMMWYKVRHLEGPIFDAWYFEKFLFPISFKTTNIS